ncbi:hypothetical protein Goari_003997 [Gossypium aridum]|uniref:RNase H type-1 domain-containing protein n=1 Tax=Gossypium aridum TaxID=34290 RepID=A0A7J8Y235_GOSAI|nr:hypothetical protein [Gossypium aridum]
MRGSAKGESSLAGCDGVLTNLNGCICRLFSVPLGTLPSTNAEIHAIYIALRLFAASPWLTFMDLFAAIDRLILVMKDVEFSNVLREANQLVDSLPKLGMCRESLFYA